MSEPRPPTSPGCRVIREYDDTTRWECTEHFRTGEAGLLHLATYMEETYDVGAMWNDDYEIHWGGMRNARTLRDALEEWDLAFIPVSDEEVRAAAVKLQKLAESLATPGVSE